MICVTIWDKWLREIAEKALLEGNLNLSDIEHLCDKMYEEGYKQGFNKGANDGYLKAVLDFEKTSSIEKETT